MEIQSSSEGVGCENVYRVLGALNSDLNRLSRDGLEVEIDAVLAGSAALAVLADRNDKEFRTTSKDVDIYTNGNMTDLDQLERVPHISRSRQNGSQLNYSLRSTWVPYNVPGGFVDIITDFGTAFGWEEEHSDKINSLLEGEVEPGEEILDGRLSVYLPSPETLSASFSYSGRDYEERQEILEGL